MPLELRYDYAQRPRLLSDGKEIKGVRLVVVEADQQGVTVQVEMMPSLESVLTHGTVNWVVCCPVCEHNSVHTCDIETKEEIPKVVTVPDPTYADPARVVHLGDPE